MVILASMRIFVVLLPQAAPPATACAHVLRIECQTARDSDAVGSLAGDGCTKLRACLQAGLHGLCLAAAVIRAGALADAVQRRPVRFTAARDSIPRSDH